MSRPLTTSYHCPAVDTRCQRLVRTFDRKHPLALEVFSQYNLFLTIFDRFQKIHSTLCRCCRHLIAALEELIAQGTVRCFNCYVAKERFVRFILTVDRVHLRRVWRRIGRHAVRPGRVPRVALRVQGDLLLRLLGARRGII